ncbi:MAG: murB [Bacteriovoracaceae bacterium]|nr:murB [Bacteriovoracaceae bacterium]
MRASSLRTFSTIKIGGSAEAIVQLKDLQNHRELPKPIRILGNGSNVLIDDCGLKGTVIITRDFSNPEPVILEENKNEVFLSVSAGLYLPTLSHWTGKRGLTGCEYMVGVPGTFGGAIIQNAGANEQELKDILVSVEVYDVHSAQIKNLSVDECKLSYRHSALKDFPNLLVTSAKIRLKRKPSAEIEKQIELNLAYRKEKTPYSKPSLGSVFTRIKEGSAWIYPGKLIEDAGLKNLRIGGAMVSPVHANYIVNEGGATFEDVVTLIGEIEKKVFEHSGKKLFREILIWSDRLFKNYLTLNT